MQSTQAQRLGELLARARIKKGLSIRGMAELVDISATWINDVERGRFPNPAPDRLARIAEALDIPASRIDRMTKGAVAGGLPEMRTYFRTKYDLTPGQVEKIERYVRRLRKEEP